MRMLSCSLGGKIRTYWCDFCPTAAQYNFRAQYVPNFASRYTAVEILAIFLAISCTAQPPSIAAAAAAAAFSLSFLQS